jgi:hypothetical protein
VEGLPVETAAVDGICQIFPLIFNVCFSTMCCMGIYNCYLYLELFVTNGIILTIDWLCYENVMLNVG